MQLAPTRLTPSRGGRRRARRTGAGRINPPKQSARGALVRVSVPHGAGEREALDLAQGSILRLACVVRDPHAGLPQQRARFAETQLESASIARIRTVRGERGHAVEIYAPSLLSCPPVVARIALSHERLRPGWSSALVG
jgi:hypothetical protein